MLSLAEERGHGILCSDDIPTARIMDTGYIQGWLYEAMSIQAHMVLTLPKAIWLVEKLTPQAYFSVAGSTLGESQETILNARYLQNLLHLFWDLINEIKREGYRRFEDVWQSLVTHLVLNKQLTS